MAEPIPLTALAREAQATATALNAAVTSRDEVLDGTARAQARHLATVAARLMQRLDAIAQAMEDGYGAGAVDSALKRQRATQDKPVELPPLGKAAAARAKGAASRKGKPS